MKLFLSTSILAVALVFASGFKIDNTHKSSGNPKDKIEIIFNRHTGFIELVMIKTELEKKRIILNYKKIEFNEQGELIALSFSVDCQDGFSGSASTDNLQNNVPFGFYRDYSKNAKAPFGTGGLTTK